MKKQRVPFVLVLSLLLVAGSAFAQTISIKCNIPFSFNAGSKSMPAGQYSIRTIGTADSKTLVLQGSEPGAEMMLSSNSAAKLDAADATKLVFHVYGSEYFLSEVWVAGNSLGHQIPVSVRERELAKGNAPQDVNVLASLR
jgi:hypothetical protein